jgi:hypothetical protein
MRRSHLVVLAICLGGGALWVLGSRGGRTDVRHSLERGAQAVSRRGNEDEAAFRDRIRSELGLVLASDVRVDVPGAFVGSGRDGAIRAAIALCQGKHSVIGLAHVEVALDDRTHANARFDVIVSESQAGDLHAETLPGRAGLQKQADAWRITSLGVEPETQPEPEPRP